MYFVDYVFGYVIEIQGCVNKYLIKLNLAGVPMYVTVCAKVLLSREIASW